MKERERKSVEPREQLQVMQRILCNLYDDSGGTRFLPRAGLMICTATGQSSLRSEWLCKISARRTSTHCDLHPCSSRCQKVPTNRLLLPDKQGNQSDEATKEVIQKSS